MSVPLSRWRPGAPRLARLLVGLGLFGVGEGLVVASELGNSPWSVFAEGLALRTPLTVGTATVVTSFALLALWVPLRVRPGLGTLLNAVLIGLAMDATLWLVGPAGTGIRVGELAAGILLVGLGSGLYLGAGLGPGPRDGLMTGLHERTGRPVSLIRGAIEVSALVVGAVLGGTFGPGTVAFAVLIGPVVALSLRALEPP